MDTTCTINMQNNTGITDKDIAMDMLIDSKATLTTLSMALTETTNPRLREVLSGQLIACINSHYRLSDIAIAKGWYNASSDPYQQLQQELSAVQAINNQEVLL